MTANHEWLALLAYLLDRGDLARPRGMITRELLAYRTVWPLSQPVITVAARGLGYRFLAAEAAWILAGDNRVATIAPFSRRISDTSDDGLRFAGAYGVKFVEQESYVVETLLRDPLSRQAVMTFWRERPAPSKDVPCTVSLQFLLRDEHLHVVATMRSSDAWLGVPYDVHSFSMIAAHVLLSLQKRDFAVGGAYRLGRLYLTAASQHLYEIDWVVARACLVDRTAPVAELDPLNLAEFTHPDQLTEHLWRTARREPGGNASWLRELGS